MLQFLPPGVSRKDCFQDLSKDRFYNSGFGLILEIRSRFLLVRDHRIPLLEIEFY